MENQKPQTINIELRTTDNVEHKTIQGEFKRLYISIETDEESVNSVIAYANIIGADPDTVFKKTLQGGIKSIRGSLSSVAPVTNLIKRYVPSNEVIETPAEELTPPGC